MSAVNVALPLLDCFLSTNGTALADGAPLPTRFGTWFWGCGLNPGRWIPNKQGTDYDMPAEIKVLAPYKDRLSVFSGFKAIVDGKPAVVHYTGSMSILTGSAPKDMQSVEAPTFDTFVADTIGSTTRFRSLELAATGNPRDSNSRRSSAVINPAEGSPLAFYTRLFGPDFKDPNAADFTPDPAVMVRQSVLSAVGDQRQAILAGLGAADKTRMDQYFTSVRQLEQQLALQLQKPAPLEACTKPGEPSWKETKENTQIDVVVANHKLMAGLMAQALACDQTRVFNVVFGEATSPLRKAGTPMTHHILTHEEPMDASLGYQKEASSFIRSIVEGFAYMLATMDSIKEGDHTLLDRSLVMTATDTGFAKIHSLENIPILLAGGANGKVKTGMHFQAKGDPVTRVGLTLQQVMGVPLDNWGTLSLNTNKPFGEIIA